MLMHNDSGLYLRHGGAERLWAAAAAAAATMDRGKTLARWNGRLRARGGGRVHRRRRARQRDELRRGDGGGRGTGVEGPVGVQVGDGQKPGARGRATAAAAWAAVQKCSGGGDREEGRKEAYNGCQDPKIVDRGKGGWGPGGAVGGRADSQEGLGEGIVGVVVQATANEAEETGSQGAQ
jgi:hypothetical protein